MNTKGLLATCCTAAMLLANGTDADGCTRVVYTGPENTVLTARSMDWTEDPDSDLWLFPRGMERDGATVHNPLRWRSKYGSVVTSAYDLCSTDGMNEVGLVANLLWLAESEYPDWNGSVPGLSIAAWVQYVLDNFATVDEAVNAMQSDDFQVVSGKMPDGSRMATLHLSISDASGDNAIFEYVNGHLDIHHSHDYNVMTNSPIFDKQLTLNDFWKTVGGMVFLPGTNRASDRFVRASFYEGALPKTSDTRDAVAGIFSVIRNTSVPLGISVPDQPNIASTRWRTVSDQKNRVYYFESTIYPEIIWVDLKQVDFSEGAPVMKLDTSSELGTYSGNTLAKFHQSTPFAFQEV